MKPLKALPELFFAGILLLLPVAAVADPPLALECSGAGAAKHRNLVHALTLTGLEGNSVVVEDFSRKETCSCKFRHGNFFDQSKGHVRHYSVQLRYQSCEAGCSRNLKRQMNASIDVHHDLTTKRSHATPFVGNVIANCDLFSIDPAALRRIEIERIDAMDQTPHFKRLLKGLKGLDVKEPAPNPANPGG